VPARHESENLGSELRGKFGGNSPGLRLAAGRYAQCYDNISLTNTMDRRQIFLDHFLGLYGVDNVKITKLDKDNIYGIAIYLDDEDEQNFCWHMTEQNVPSEDLIKLIKVIKDNKFIRADKIIVTADTIFGKSGWTDMTKFKLVYDKLFDIEVKMIDNGEETDSYFIHD
jgi:hypothetical protein